MYYSKKSITLILLFCLVQLIIGVLHAECILPVADGNGAVPSPANIEGVIWKVSATTIVISEKQTKQKHKIRLTYETDYFTTAGGFLYTKELLPKQTVWIWFENCHTPKKGSPKAAIVQIYSTNPSIKP